MKEILTTAIIAISILTNASAQNLQKSINQVNNTINNTNGTVRNAQVTINDTKELLKGVSGFFGKNKNKAQENQTTSQPDNSQRNAAPAASEPVATNTNAGNTNPASNASSNQTIITISNLDYMKQKTLSQQLKENKDVTAVEPSLNGNVATFIVKHNGSTDSILDFLMEKSGSQLQVKSFQKGIIDLASK